MLIFRKLSIAEYAVVSMAYRFEDMMEVMVQPLIIPLQLKDMDWMIQGLIYLNRSLKIFRVEFPIEDVSHPG